MHVKLPDVFEAIERECTPGEKEAKSVINCPRCGSHKYRMFSPMVHVGTIGRARGETLHAVCHLVTVPGGMPWLQCLDCGYRTDET